MTTTKTVQIGLDMRVGAVLARGTRYCATATDAADLLDKEDQP